MFITHRPNSGYTRNGSQIASGLFLILINPRELNGELRAIIRQVSMQQCGHFMMGSVRLAGHSFTLSGSYGSDGLPLTLRVSSPEWPHINILTDAQYDAIYNQCVPLPQELYNAWATGEGWNSAGNEATAMRAWANANMKSLRATIHNVK